MLCEDRGAGVALLIGITPVALIAREIQLDLPGLKLGLLQAEEVGVQAPEDILKAFFTYGAQAVNIP